MNAPDINNKWMFCTIESKENKDHLDCEIYKSDVICNKHKTAV